MSNADSTGTFVTQRAKVGYKDKYGNKQPGGEADDFQEQPSQTSQSTLLLQKKKLMEEAQSELDRKKEEIRLRMLRCQEKEDELAIVQADLRAQVIQQPSARTGICMSPYSLVFPRAFPLVPSVSSLSVSVLPGGQVREVPEGQRCQAAACASQGPGGDQATRGQGAGSARLHLLPVRCHSLASIVDFTSQWTHAGCQQPTRCD